MAIGTTIAASSTMYPAEGTMLLVAAWVFFEVDYGIWARQKAA
jgi:hypothetical protein